MLKETEIKNAIWFDMETCPIDVYEKIKDSQLYEIWKNKFFKKSFIKEEEFRKSEGNLNEITEEQIWTKYSPLQAEFARIWCISFGVFNIKGEIEIFTLRSDDEKTMIKDFLTFTSNYPDFLLAGFNIVGFDMPFFLKRMWVNGIFDYSPQFQLRGVKPWSLKVVDLMIEWKNMSNENISLDLLCTILNIPTPKDKFSNHEFTTLLTHGKISEEEGIAYCEKDVKATMLAAKKLVSSKSFTLETPKKWTK